MKMKKVCSFIILALIVFNTQLSAQCTITLTSLPATTSQTVCTNTAITNIMYATTGATGAIFNGLPAGVLGFWVDSIITIIGTPTPIGTFNYTVTLTPAGTCSGVTATGTITATANNTIALSSAPGTDSQSVCTNTAFANITYTTTGAAGAGFSGLPAGVTGSWAANTVTISGTPIISGTFNYLVILTGGCGYITKPGTIIVNPLPTAVATPSSQVICSGEAIDTIRFSGTGTTYTWTRNNTVAVTGIAASGSGNISDTLTNTTNAPVTVTFTITPVKDGCNGTPITASVLVNPAPIVGIEPNEQVVCNSTSTTAVNFTGPVTGTIFNWTNNKPSIGLAASGTGNIAAFNATNTTNLPDTATVTFTPTAGGFAYIPNSGSNNVSVINTATDTVVATVAVGSNPFGVSVSPNGSRVYVSNKGDNTVSVINTANNTVIATVAVGSDPYGVSVSPNGSRVYVANPLSNNVSSINTTTNTVVSTIAVGILPYGLAVNPVLNFLYVANEGSGTVSVINTLNNLIVATIAVGFSPHGLSVNPDGSRLYVTIAGNPNKLSVINTATNTVVDSVAMGNYPFGVSVSPDGSRVYVTNTDSYNVFVINTATNVVVDTIVMGVKPGGISASPNGRRVYVACYDNNKVYVINTITNTVVDSVIVGSYPNAFGNFITGGTNCIGKPKTFTITVNPSPKINQPFSQVVCNDSLTAAVIFQDSIAGAIFNWTNNNTLINLPRRGTGNIAAFNATNTSNTPITATVTVNSTAGGFAYISNSGSNTVSVIKMATNTVVDSVNVGSIPKGVSVSPNGSRVYVANSGSNNISIINTTSNSVIATVPVGTGPSGVSVSPDDSSVYVANSVSNTVSVIKTVDNSVIATVPVGTSPSGVSVSPNGSWVYVANQGSNNVSVINTSTNSVIATVPVGTGPSGVSVSPNGSRVYVANSDTNNISIINTTSNSVLATVPVGTGPSGVSVSPNGSRVYVVNSRSNNISIINGTSNSVLATVPVGLNPIGVSVSPDGRWVYVTNKLDSTVSVLNTATNSVVGTVNCESGPFAFGNFITGGTTCTGVPRTFTITVKPKPNAVATPSSQTICSASNISTIVLNSATAGTTYRWTRDNTVAATGIAASGTDNIIGTLTNITTAPVTVTFTITPTANGCAGAAITATVTVTPQPTATISYTGSPYCSNAGTANVTFTGTAGGTYSAAPSGLSINDTTGAINLGASTPGTYTVTYTVAASGGCVVYTTTTTITITQLAAATISYTGSPYCSNAGTATVTRTGTAGGTYSAAPAGLTINAATGAVTLANSTSGTYTVTYTLAAGGGCPTVTATASITITQLPAATISYTGSPYCSNAGTATVTRTGTAGGIYSSTAGLTINVTTGDVTLSTSTPGTYTVTYTIAAAGGCAVFTTTTSITITQLPAATISYTGSPYCSNAGTATVTRTGTAGGTYSAAPAGLTLNAANGDVTLGTSTPGTYTVTYTIAASGGCPAVTATTTITITALPTATISYAGTPYCSNAGTATVTQTGTAGGTYTAAPAGLSINAATGAVTLGTSTPGTYTVTYTIAASSGCPAVTTTTAIIIYLTPTALATPDLQTVCSSTNTTIIITGNAPPGVAYNWTRDNNVTVTGSMGNSGQGNISGTLTNTANVPITVTFTITPIANNCQGLPITAKVLVNPSPAKPIFSWPILNNGILCQGSSNINFYVKDTFPGIKYLWSSGPSNVSIKDTNDANTVISFQDAGVFNIKVEAIDALTACKNSDSQRVTVSTTNGIDKRRIILKQPGNLLIYPDNSMDYINGYQWGYDSLLRPDPNRAYSAPITIPGQVYQVFIPDKRFIKNNQLDTFARAFWVLLQKGNCYTRVYYNGPYSFGRIAIPPPEDNTVRVKVVPNPNNGVFDINLDGNIYGDMQATIYNALGQQVYKTEFSKTVPGIRQRFNTGLLPNGLYYIDIRSSDLKRIQTRFVIQH